MAALIIDGFDTQLAAFAAPLILKQWHIGNLAFAPVFAAALGGMAVGAAVGGVLGDRLGRQRVIVVSVAIFGVCTMLVSLSSSIGEMGLLRLASGLGFGATLPNIFALIAEWVPQRLRVTVVTISTIGVPTGGMIGAAIVAWAMPLFGWRDCFAGAGILTLLYAGLLAFKLPESPAFLAAHMRRGEALASETAGEHSSKISDLFLRQHFRRTLGLAIASFCAGYLGYAFANWVPIILSAAKFSLRAAITGSFFVNLFAIAGALVMSVLIPRIGSRLALWSSLVVFAAATGALEPAIDLSLRIGGNWPTGLVMAALAGVGFGIGSLASSTFTLAVHAYPAVLRATGSGLANSLNRIGAFLTPFLGAWLLNLDSNRSGMFLISAFVFILLAAVGALIYDVHIRARSD